MTLFRFLFRIRLLYVRFYFFFVNVLVGPFSRMVLFYALIHLLQVFGVLCFVIFFIYALNPNELIEYLGTGSMNFKAQVTPVYNPILDNPSRRDNLVSSDNNNIALQFEDYRIRQDSLYAEYLAKRTLWRQWFIPDYYKSRTLVLDLTTFTSKDLSASKEYYHAPELIHVYRDPPCCFAGNHNRFDNIFEVLSPMPKAKFFSPEWRPFFESIGLKPRSKVIDITAGEFRARCANYNSIVTRYETPFFDHLFDHHAKSKAVLIDIAAQKIPRFPTASDRDFNVHYRYFYDTSVYLPSPVKKNPRVPFEHPLFGSLGYENIDTNFVYYANNYSRDLRSFAFSAGPAPK